VVFVKLPEK